MRSIVGFSLKFRFLMVIIAAALIVFGVAQLRAMPVDVLPEFSPPYVEIQTESLGLSAQEVEQLITVPMEQDLLIGLPWLDTIRSDSMPGLSSIVLIFKPGTNLMRARQMVAERMTQAVALPHVSKPPTILQPFSSTSRFMIVGLSSKSLSQIQMSVLTRWTISPRLMGVPGVANVATWGQRDRQLQVQIDPKRLQDHKVSLLQVLETTGNALWVSTLSFVEASTPGTGGFVETSNQRLGIRHILPIVSPEGLAQVPIEDTGVRLGDVANIVEDHQPLIGDALTNEGASLLLVIEKFPGANTLDVTRGVEDALAELQPGLPGLKIDSTIFRPADFIKMAINNLAVAALLGLLLVVVVLAAFFFDWRTTLISLVAIVLSLVAAGLALYATGATINIIVLTGLLIAIGVVVEDAIIDVENIVRRLRQYRKEGAAQPTVTIMLEASLEMRGAIIYGMLILLLAISPIFFIGGLSGSFVQPLAVAYGLAVLASMLVALTITPALSLILLANTPVERREPPLVVWLQRVYESVLARAIQRSRPMFGAVGVLTLVALVILPFLKLSLVPSFKERDLRVHLTALPGTSQPEMSRISGRVSQELRSIPGVRNVGVLVGRAVLGDQVVNVNSAELWVSIDPVANYDRTVAAIQAVVSGYPGLHHDVQTYLNRTTGELAGAADNSLIVRLYGDTDEVLRTQGENVRKALAGINGIVDTRINLPLQQLSLETEVDLAAAQRYGLKPGDVRRAAATLLAGIQVGNLFEEQKVFDVVVWSTPETRHSLSSVQNLMIDTPNGGRARLGDVAKVRIVPTSSDVRHEAVKRYVDVVASVKGRDLGAVEADIKSRLHQVQFPLEYHAEVLAGHTEQQATQTRLLVLAVTAVLGIFLLLQASFSSWRVAFLAILTLPMSLAGSVVAVFLGGGVISLGALAGFLTVLGIAVRNGIVLTTHYHHLERQEGEPFGSGLVLRGARERLPAILMTALATTLALVPALFLGDLPGLEIVRPMAVVILGGLVTCTVLDLFFLPAFYLRYGASCEPDLELAVAQEKVPGGMSGATSMGVTEA
jgi:CzcA family heavy metal efflux pump